MARRHDLVPDRYRPALLRRTGVTVSNGVITFSGLRVIGDAGVVGDCDPHGVYVGSPARRLRDLPASIPDRA